MLDVQHANINLHEQSKYCHTAVVNESTPKNLINESKTHESCTSQRRSKSDYKPTRTFKKLENAEWRCDNNTIIEAVYRK